MISVTFFIKSSKKNKEGKVPVLIKLYRTEEDYTTVYTKVRVSPDDWDGFRVLETDMFHAQYNAMLERTKADILLQCVNHATSSAEEIKAFYLNTFKVKFTIGDLIKDYIQYKLDDEEMTNDDTIRTYKTHRKVLIGHLKALQLYGHNAATFAYPEGRILYHRLLKHHSPIYSNKLMWKLKSSVEWGVGERLIEANSISGFELKSIPHKELTSEDYLNLEEVTRIINAKCPEQYNRAKALATLQLFTGMAFADVSNFDPEMVKNMCNKKVLVGKRRKTGHEFIVPLNLVALGVIEGYQWWGTKPISKDTYNPQLKVLAAYAGITKNVTSHMLRRSFAQLMLNGGVSAEVLAKMLGHINTRMLRFYAIVTSTRVLEEMETKRMLEEMESRMAA
jgi:integrase/recombinase XerD